MPVRDAQQTVALADSLRVNEGVTCDDSLALANAYTTLGHWRLIYPNAYARACYYYGRMLRNRNDQVSAMRAFISGTHAPYMQRVIPIPWFSDYHILGRIYSNMGTMSHLAGEFELSYEMYKTAAEQIIKTNDSTSYYYLLNDMAVELAEQKLTSETFTLLEIIEKECTSVEVLTKIWETRAILYQNIGQYDSAIYSANQLNIRDYYAATGYVIEAQSFWYKELYDSALHYANIALNHPYSTTQDRYHMLYILINHDTIVSKQKIQALSAERADLDYEYVEPLLQQLSVAVELLLRDLNKKPYYLNIGLLLCTLCLVGGITWASITSIKRHKRHLYAETERERQKQFELRQQQETIRSQRVALLERNCAAIRNSEDIETTLCWKKYDQMCQYINDVFFLFVTKLTAVGKFNEYEIQLCVLVLLDLDYQTMSRILHHAQNGIGKAKFRIAQKLGTTTKNLRQILINLAIDAPTELSKM